MVETVLTSVEFPVAPLEDLYATHGSKDAMAKTAVSQLVQSLVEFGVSPSDVEYHLTEEAKKVNKG